MARTDGGGGGGLQVSVGPMVGRADSEPQVDVAAENARAVKGGRQGGFL